MSHFFWSQSESVAYADTYIDAGASTEDVFFTNETAETAKSGFTVNGVTGKYRTLSTAEWQYLFNTRTVNGGTGLDKSYSLNITYGGMMGLVLYPDDYCGDPISGEVSYLPKGAVFLPAAGRRNSDNIVSVGEYGFYWSSSSADEASTRAFPMGFSDTSFVSGASEFRKFGISVRLVTECQ